MSEKYESLTAAIALLDAAVGILDDEGICADEIDALHQMRNDLNADRLAILGNGQDRPFHVAELNLNEEPHAN